MLAASLVFSASPNNPPAFSHVAQPVACSSQATEGGSRAKTLGSLAFETDAHGAKGPSRGRSISLGALKAFEGSDDGEDGFQPPSAPTRDNRYVCPSDMVMIGRSYCIDVYEASLMQVMK